MYPFGFYNCNVNAKSYDILSNYCHFVAVLVFANFIFLFFCSIQSDLIQTSMISEYDMGGEGDLFKAPEPIIEEPVMSLDPMSAAMSLISCGEDVISRQALKVADIESLQQEQLLSEVLYECEKDLLEQAAMEVPLSEVLEIKIPSLRIDGNQFQENKPLFDLSFQKSVSSECLSSMDWMHGPMTTPSFLEFRGMDLGAAYGMRRAFSEGDIKVRFDYSYLFSNIVYEIELER